MSRITHAFLDVYESVKGEYERLPEAQRRAITEAEWEAVDELLLDLHLIQHGYATDGYAKHIERRLLELGADASVVERMRELRF